MGMRIAGAQANARVFAAADALEGAADCIENAPVVDAEHVRHGRWMETPIGTIKCSECGCGFNLNELLAHYCPNCGAKVQGNKNAAD